MEYFSPIQCKPKRQKEDADIRHRVRAPGAPAVAAGTPGDGSNRSRSNAKRCGAEAFQ